MRSFWANLVSLVIPGGAPPGSPRITIGTVLPADLVAFYADPSQNGTAVAGLIFYPTGTTEYVYLILVQFNFSGIPALCCGTRDNGGIAVTFEIFPPANPALQQTFLNLGDGTQGLGFFTASLFGLLRSRSGSKIQAESGSTLQVDLGAAFTIDGTSAPRGSATNVSSQANSAAVGAETVVLTCPSATFKANRAYRLMWGADLHPSVANTTAVSVRKTNTAGQKLSQFQEVFPVGSVWTRGAASYFTIGGADVTAVLVLTTNCSGGTVTHEAGAVNPRFLAISDVGAAADFANLPVLA